MTYNLKDFRFTLLSDTVIKLEDIVVNTSVDTLTGSDVVSGTSSPTGTGLKIESTGSLTTGFGGDRLLGVSSGLGALQPGTGISNAGVVQMGFDNDIIRGVVTGESGGGGTASFNKGILNLAQSRIDMGYGDDVVSGDSGGNGYGIFNEANASILTGFGKDVVTGTGGRGYGVYNDGLIDTGFDDDVVTGNAAAGSFASFTGNGLTKLGYGNDRIEGFGSGKFDGGFGADRLLFKDPGVYKVSLTPTDGYFSITASTDGTATKMFVKDFEWLGQVGGSSGFVAFAPGASITIV